jgi:hypothetical protein
MKKNSNVFLVFSSMKTILSEYFPVSPFCVSQVEAFKDVLKLSSYTFFGDGIAQWV